MTEEATTLYEALVACGEDYAKTLTNGDADHKVEGLFRLLSEQPVTIICDKLNQKLEDMGHRVMQVRVGKVKQF